MTQPAATYFMPAIALNSDYKVFTICGVNGTLKCVPLPNVRQLFFRARTISVLRIMPSLVLRLDCWARLPTLRDIYWRLVITITTALKMPDIIAKILVIDLMIDTQKS